MDVRFSARALMDWVKGVASMRNHSRPWMQWVVLMAALLVFLVHLGRPRLGSPHEARVVVTGRNMAESGDWIVPHFNGQIRLQKPPLPYWTMACLVKAFGPVEEGLFRLPSALMGVGVVLMTFFMARSTFDRETGLWAALVLALSTKFIIESRLARVDIYLTFWSTASLLILTVIFFGARRRDWLWIVLGVCLGLAVLAKWVNVFLFVLAPAVYGLIMLPDRRPRWTWLAACAATLGVLGLSWIILLVHRIGWETLAAAWHREIYDNVTTPVRSGNHGVLYYIPQLPVLTFPWSVLGPVALILPLVPRFKPQRVQLVWWVLVVLIPLAVLSFVSKKKVDYLLPALPALAVLAARAWKGIEEEIAPEAPAGIRNPRTPIGLIQPAVLLLAALGPVGYCLWDREAPRMGAALAGGLSLGAGGALALRAVLQGRGREAFLALCAGAAGFSLILFGVLVPGLSRTSSAGFAHAVMDIVGDAPLVYYRGRDDTLVYYLGRPIPSAATMKELRGYAQDHPGAFVLVQAAGVDEARQVAPDVVLHDPRFRDVSAPLPGQGKRALEMYLLSGASCEFRGAHSGDPGETLPNPATRPGGDG